MMKCFLLLFFPVLLHCEVNVISLDNEYPIEMNEINTKNVNTENQLQPPINEAIISAKTFHWEYIIGLFALGMLFLVAKQQPEIPINQELELKKLKKLATIRALKYLQDLDTEQENKQEFYSKLSEVLRNYMEDYYAVHAPKETTEEFLNQIRKNPYFDSKTQNALAEILSKADIVKFAEYTPTEIECKNAQSSAARLINTGGNV